MAHLDEGTLQAYLDDELPGRDRAGAAEHLLRCGECRAELDTLKRANERLAAALAELDAPTPGVRAPAPVAHARPRTARHGLRRGSLVRAAVLVLLVAAAASASVPGSPIREWIVQATRPEPPAPEAPAAPVVEPAPALPPAPAGVAMSAADEVDVVVTGLEGAVIRLVRTEGSDVAVAAKGGARDPLFRMASGRIEVVGGVGGELLVEVPRAAPSVRLLVDGRPYAESVRGELRILEPAEQDGEALLWR